MDKVFDGRGRRVFSVAAIVSLFAFAGVFLVSSPLHFGASGNSYVLRFDEGTNRFVSETVAWTDNRNPLRFSASGYETALGAWGSLAPLGWLANQDPIAGLQSLEVRFLEGEAGSLSLDYGWDDSTDDKKGIVLSPSANRASFDGLAPSYFRLSNPAGALTVVGMTLAYSCLASPAPHYVAGGVTYALASDQASYAVKSYDGSIGAVAFLSAVNGLPVTAIGNNAMAGNGSRITSLSLPSSITEIGANGLYGCKAPSLDVSHILSFGDYALGNCSKLTRGTLASDLTALSSYCFSNCSALQSIYLPASLVSVGHYAFYNCGALALRCGALAKPSGWDAQWNPGNRPVEWGALA